jgi:hypothetical protein
MQDIALVSVGERRANRLQDLQDFLRR